MIEKFTGLSGVESYNLFSDEEYQQSSSAFVRFVGNNDKMWHMGRSVVMDYGPLFVRSGMADDVYICGKRQLNLAAPRLYINKVSIQYKQAPFRPSEEELIQLTSANADWKVLVREVTKIRWVSREVESSTIHVALESFQRQPRALSIIRDKEPITVSAGIVYLTVSQARRLQEEGIPIHPPVKPEEALSTPIDLDQVIEELKLRAEKRYYEGR